MKYSQTAATLQTMRNSKSFFPRYFEIKSDTLKCECLHCCMVLRHIGRNAAQKNCRNCEFYNLFGFPQNCATQISIKNWPQRHVSHLHIITLACTLVRHMSHCTPFNDDVVNDKNLRQEVHIKISLNHYKSFHFSKLKFSGLSANNLSEIRIFSSKYLKMKSSISSFPYNSANCTPIW